MPLEDLDMTDRKILSAFDENARVSYSELGKRIRVAKETVKYRVKQLQAEGIIKGFYTVINFSRMGFVAYRLYLRLQSTPPSVEKDINDYLMKSKKVVVFYRVEGPFNIVLGVLARDIWEYEQFWTDLRKRFGEYFSNYRFSILTDFIEFSRPYLLPSKKDEKTMFSTITKTKPENLDELDFKLLTFISNNARASLVNISKHLGVSVVTVRHRLKKLISKKVIVGFRPIFNLRALGREYYKVDIWFRKYDRTEEIAQHLLSHPNVAYSEKSIIVSDLEIDIETKNFDSFISIMNSFKEKFPDDIKDYAYYSLIKNYKVDYVPSV